MNPYDICYGIPYGSARMLTLYIANPSLDICIIYIYMYDIHDDILYPAQISGLVLFPITATICVLYINAYNDHIYI